MKSTNFKLLNQIEYLSPDKSTDYFSEYIKSIIEDSSRAVYKRVDYIGISLQEAKSRIDALAQDISELQQYKKRLSQSLEMAKEIIANTLVSNGINDRLDGSIISSLTLTKSSTKTKQSIEIVDEDKVMQMGHIMPDLESIKKALETKEGSKSLEKYLNIQTTTVATPQKVKVNTKRTTFNTQADELLGVVESAA
jgi:hypothetical protein